MDLLMHPSIKSNHPIITYRLGKSCSGKPSHFCQALNIENTAWAMPVTNHDLFVFAAVALLIGGVFFPVFVYKRVKAEVVGLLKEQGSLKAEIEGLQMHLREARESAIQKDQRIDWLEREARLLETNAGVSVQGAVKAFQKLQEDLFELDIQTDTIFMQDTWLKALGYTADPNGRMPTAVFKSYLNDEDQFLFESTLSCSLSKQLNHATVLLTIQSPERGYVKCEFKLTSVANAYGLNCAVVGIMRDRSKEFSQAREVENELSFTRDLAMSRHKFLTNLSHELRTPLTTLGSALALLETMIDRGHLNADKLKKFVWQAKDATLNMREITDQTLSLVEIKQRRLNKSEGVGVDSDRVENLNDLMQGALKLDLKRRRKGDELLTKFELDIPIDLQTDRGAQFWTTVTRQMLAIVFYEEALFKFCRLYLSEDKGALNIDIAFKHTPDWVKCVFAGNDEQERNGGFKLDRDTLGLPFFLELVTLVFKGLSHRIELAAHYVPARLKIRVPISISLSSSEKRPKVLESEVETAVVSEQ